MRAPPPPGSAPFDVVGIGEISVDDVVLLAGAAPRWGGKLLARGRERIGGGQVATAMVALARLGLRTALVGAVGSDEAGAAAIEGLRAEGVDTRGVRRVDGARTRTAVILVDEAGERTVIADEDPRLGLELDAEGLALCAAGRVLHADGSFPAASRAAAERARAAGRVVSCDLELDGQDGEAARALLPLVDLTLLAGGLSGDGVSERPGAAGDDGVVVLTLGERGAIGWEGRAAAPRSQPAFTVAKVVDTTACGDTFRAGFLCAFLDGGDLGACLRFGCAAAALKVRDLGRRGCPRRDEVEALLQEAA